MSGEEKMMGAGEESNPWRDEIVRTIFGDVGMIKKVYEHVERGRRRAASHELPHWLRVGGVSRRRH